MIGNSAELPRSKDDPPPRLGVYSSMAQGAWTGSQATGAIEDRAGRRFAVRLPRLRFGGLFTREFTIAEATVVLMASFFGSALLGLVRQVLFNAQFGAGDVASAYYAAFRLPDTLFSLIAGGALSSAMIPVLLSTAKDRDESSAWRLVSLVLTALMSVLSVIVLLGIIFAPFFVNNVLAPGFDAETSALTARLTRIMMIQPLVLAVGTVLTAVLNSRNQFMPTALAVMSHNVALIAGIMVSRAFPEVGIYGPTGGVIAGAILQLLIMFPGFLKTGARLEPAFDFKDSGLREVVRLLVPNGLAVGVGYAGFILDTAFASGAREREALPAIQNAWLMAGLPITLLGQAVGQAAFPRLAAAAAAYDWRKMRLTLGRALSAVVVLALPAVLVQVLFGRAVIATVFEQGKFDATAGDLTARVLTAYAIALPAYVATEVIVRGLIALRDTRTPLITNTFQLAGRAVIVSLLIDGSGVVAIPIAFAVTASIESVVLGSILAVKLRRRLAEQPSQLPAVAPPS